MHPTARVWVVTNSYPHPGRLHAAWYLQEQVELLRAKGMRVDVFSPMDSRSGPVRGPVKYGRLALAMCAALLRGSPDLVSAHWAFPSGLLAWAVTRVIRRPYIVWSYGAYVGDFWDRPLWARTVVRLALRSADRVMAISEEHRQRIVDITGLERKDIGVFTPGISLAGLRRDQGSSRARYSLEAAVPWIGFVGDLIPRKGVDLLLRALARLSALDWRLLIGGTGPAEGQLKELAGRLGIANRCLFLGMVRHEDVGMIFSASDIVVVPSWAEPFGLVAPEAMACGAAVVASNVGGLGETIRDGVNGLLFPVGDPQALAVCLETLLQEPELRSRLTRAALEDSLAFDRRVHTDRMYQELSSLAGRRNGVRISPTH